MPKNTDDDTTTENTDDDTTTETTEEDTTTTTEDTTEQEPDDGTDTTDDTTETFPKAYVEKLRKESAGYRERAQQSDALAQRLHTSLVAATGRLADPTDLPFDAEHLDEPDKLTAAIEDLLARKPHLANRTPHGDIGQGAGGVVTGGVDLAGILRSRA